MQIKYENSSLFIESTDKELDKELGVEHEKGVRTNLLACMPQINNDLMGDFSGRGLLAADKCIAFEKSLSLSEEQKIVVVREKYMTGFNMDMFFPVFASVNLFYLKCIENFSLPFLEGGGSNRDLNCHESCEWDEVSNHLDVGARLHTAENSSLFRAFIAPELIDLSIDFNKKDVFSDCLRMGGFRVADYVTFDIAEEDLDCLFACKYYKFFALFENYLDLQGIYDRDKTYFLKINISFAGIGVVRLNPLNVHNLKALLTRYMGFRDAGLHVTLILSESLIVRPAPARSFLSYNDPYQSPNVTFAIADNGIFFNQASEQIIGNFTSYKGSTWSADLEKKFLDVRGEEVHRLAECLYTQGYRGYFGTDYVLGSSSSKQESYCLIGDGNFRINGSHSSFRIRKALIDKGFEVTSTYQTIMTLDFFDSVNSEDKKKVLLDDLYQVLSNMSLKEVEGGIAGGIFFPWAATSYAISVKLVYINPELDLERYVKLRRYLLSS